MPVAKPASVPRWAEDIGGTPSANIVEPASSQKDSGWPGGGYKPPAEFFNWFQQLTYRWILYLQDLENQAITWTALHVFQKKVTITAGVASNHAGAVIKGDGSGAGVTGTGGDTAGTSGVHGTGGVGGGIGVKGTAIGAYPGVEGTGGGSGTAAPGVKGTGGVGGSAGVEGTGGGAGAGVKGTGGASGAPGVEGTGTNNNAGGSFTGHGGASGVVATGGASDGTGGTFTGGASNANGLTGTGTGIGTGVVGTGGASGIGVYASGNGGSPALVVAAGHAQFTGTQPTKSADPGLNNMACGTNQVKAWGWLKSGAGTPVIEDGYNASVTLSGNAFVVAFARNMANANYSVTVTQDNYTSQNKIWTFTVGSKTVSGFEINVYQIGDSMGYAYAVPTLGTGDADDIGVSFKVCARQ